MQKNVLLIESDAPFARALAAALESRGFGARRERTSLLEIGFHARDALALASGAAALAAFVLARFVW